jgi:hypothetical protein
MILIAASSFSLRRSKSIVFISYTRTDLDLLLPYTDNVDERSHKRNLCSFGTPD